VRMQPSSKEKSRQQGSNRKPTTWFHDLGNATHIQWTTRRRLMMDASNSKKMPKIHSCQERNALFLLRSANEMLLPIKFFENTCQYLQMRTLNGFSNSTAWADSFTAESEIPRLGQIVSLPNPRCRMGFQLKPSFAHRALLPNSIFKMNSR
jgi:hypothetical protein